MLLGQCSGEMFDWWFCHVDDTERYIWWHPKDHVTGTWDEEYFTIPSNERTAGKLKQYREGHKIGPRGVYELAAACHQQGDRDKVVSLENFISS